MLFLHLFSAGDLVDCRARCKGHFFFWFLGEGQGVDGLESESEHFVFCCFRQLLIAGLFLLF